MLLAKLQIPLTLALVLAGTGAAHRLVQAQAAEAQASPKQDQPMPGEQAAASAKPGAVFLTFAQGKKQAEMLFRASAKKLAEADVTQMSVECTLEGTRQKGRIKGTFLLAKGNKASWVVEGNILEEGNILYEKYKMSFVSNGTKMKMEMTGQKSQEEEDTPENLNTGFLTAISRAGMHVGLFRLISGREGEKEPGLDEQLNVSDFVLGKKEKVGEGEAQLIDYKLVIYSGPGTIPARSICLGTLWLDTETKLPLKRVLSFTNTNDSRRVTEMYQIRVNGKMDEKMFALPR